jgi:hypothetical protein
MPALTQAFIDKIVASSLPERLSLEEKSPVTDDHVAHILQLTEWGQTGLGADHLLFPEINGSLTKIVSGVIRELNILFAVSRPSSGDAEEPLLKKIRFREYAYELLMEMALGFHGLESRWLDEGEKSKSLHFISNVLGEWESLERLEGEVSIASAVVKKWLSKMKRVQKGNSMGAKAASRIEGGLDVQKNLFAPFLNQAEAEIKGNIYYQMVKQGKCKFGNDYALGLRWLRHLGFEQVSTNPVLAARAYQDDPDLAVLFGGELKHHPQAEQWSGNPAAHGDEIALFATLLALWDNLHVFRPLFFNLRRSSGGGVVSFQLNPNIAHLAEESIRDVFKAFLLASENLSVYDRYLLAGYRVDGERGRPNMVIKVAATTPAARTITQTINAFGFGSNITIDYSVSQEATLILDEMDGMAKAVRKGIPPTQLYMTNMGGRLESHLREVKLEELFQELKRKIGEKKAIEKLERLSEANGTKDKVSPAKTYEEKVLAATRYAHGQKTLDHAIGVALEDVVSTESLQDWEEAISRSGTLVARRVWGVFFCEENRDRWVTYLMKKHGLAQDQARLIMDRIHCLPASKRKPFDTFWTLACRNLVHTEFPDHQENVRKMAEDPKFSLKECEESIRCTFPSDIPERLSRMDDFQKAYEVNPELAEIFAAVGISEDFGLKGMKPSDWPEFGPVQKTLAEFKAAYDAFKKEMVSLSWDASGSGRTV